jgi:RHS repeat-associated protein
MVKTALSKSCAGLALLLWAVAAIATPSGPLRYAWSFQQSSPNASASGEEGSLVAAVAAMRASSEGASYLSPESRSIVASSGIVTEVYAPSPELIAPTVVSGPEFTGTNCGNAPVCNPTPAYSSYDAMRSAFLAYYNSAANGYCPGAASWTETSTWYRNTTPPVLNVPADNPQVAVAFIEVDLKYKSKPPGQPCATTESGGNQTFKVYRNLDCGPGFSNYLPTGTFLSFCRNTTSGSIEYFSTEMKSDDCVGKVGNPCDAATGAKIEPVVDYEGPGPGLTRTYRSNLYYRTNGLAAPLGPRWRHSYERDLFASTGENWTGIQLGDGGVLALTRNTATRYLATDAGTWVFQRETQTAPGVPFTTTYNWTLYGPDGSREIYQRFTEGSSSGWVLWAIDSPEGHRTRVNYGSLPLKLVSTVVDPWGHSLEFVWTNGPTSNCTTACENRLDKVRIPGGQVVDYEYLPNDPTGWGPRLEGVVWPDARTQRYRYEGTQGQAAHLLAGIIDGAGSDFATFAYTADRVTLSKHAGGFEQVTLDYLGTNTAATTDDATIVTDAQGGVSTYRFSGGATAFRRVSTTTYPDGGVFEQLVNSRRQVTDQYLTLPAAQGGTAVDHVKNAYSTTFPYRLSQTTEAFGTPEQRVTTYTYLNSLTSDLPTVIRQPSVLGPAWQQWTTIAYCTNGTPGCPSERPQLVRSVTVDTRVTSTGSPDPAQPSRTTTYSYNAYGHVIGIDGPRSDVADVTTIDWWDEVGGQPCTTGGQCGQIKSVTNAVGHSTNYSYEPATGRLSSVTDPNGLVTGYTYDGSGRVLTIVETPAVGLARTTAMTYDPNGQLDVVTHANGYQLDYAWTPAHLLDSVTDNLGNRIEYAYDLRGNQTAENVRDVSGVLTRELSRSYDTRNHLATQGSGPRTPELYTVDSSGRLRAHRNGRYFTTQYAYDGLARLDSITDALTSVTGVDYTVADQLASLAAPGKTATGRTYNDLADLLREFSPDRGWTHYGYDAAGNVTCKADGRMATAASTCATISGRWVMGRDAIGRLTSIDYTGVSGSDPEVELLWDSRPGAPDQRGRLRRVVMRQDGATITRLLDYDAWGNVTWVQQTTVDANGTKTLTASYSYDGRDQLLSITYPSGRLVEYTRDAMGRIDQVKSTFGGVQQTIISDVGYYAFGPVSALTYGNGLLQNRMHDTAYDATLFTLVHEPTSGYYYSLEYQRDFQGNVDYYHDYLQPGKSRNYDYDGLDRLVLDSGHFNTGPTFSYDANGNRLARSSSVYGNQTITYQPGNNRLATLSGTGTVTYDGMGNLLNRGTLTFTYAPSGRLNSIVNSATSITGRQLYNGLGELARHRLTSPHPTQGGELLESVEHFLFAPNGQVLHLTAENAGGTATDVIWVDNLPVAQLVASYDAGGLPQGTPALTYLHPDHLGSPRLGTNAARQVTWRWESEAFGQNTPNVPMGSAIVRLRFPGQIDLNVGLLAYNYYRTYDPLLGRYLESDPIGVEGGLNTYGYVDGNPATQVDPLGLAKDSITARIEAAILRGDARELQALIEGGSLNPLQTQLARQGVQSISVIGRTTTSTSRVAELLGRSNREIRAAIEQCKQKSLPRSGRLRNPDVRVDPRTGEVYPDLGGGRVGDSIGNIFEFLKP